MVLQPKGIWNRICSFTPLWLTLGFALLAPTLGRSSLFVLLPLLGALFNGASYQGLFHGLLVWGPSSQIKQPYTERYHWQNQCWPVIEKNGHLSAWLLTWVLITYQASYEVFLKPGREPTCLVHIIPRTGKRLMSWVLKFQHLITYLDDWNFILLGYQS
jgi:hypothetical protein